MPELILPGGMDPNNTDILLPDGTVHRVEPDPEPEPTSWEIMQAEFRQSGAILEQARRAQSRIIRATLVEAMALRSMAGRY